jgi:hypothetical protein
MANPHQCHPAQVRQAANSAGAELQDLIEKPSRLRRAIRVGIGKFDPAGLA